MTLARCFSRHLRNTNRTEVETPYPVCVSRLTLIFGGPAARTEWDICPDPVNEEDWLEEEEEEEAANELPDSLCLRPSGGGCNLNLKGDGCCCPSSPPPGCWLSEWESGRGGPCR